MAGSGPAPKPDGQRRRRNAPTHGPERVVVPDGVLRGPEALEAWDEDVRAWWDTWRAAPQAALFEPTDWSRLRMLVPTVERALKGSIAAMTEVRMSESLLGATVTDRLKARIRVDHDAPSVPPQLASVSTIRDDLAKRLEGSA